MSSAFDIVNKHAHQKNPHREINGVFSFWGVYLYALLNVKLWFYLCGHFEWYVFNVVVLYSRGCNCILYSISTFDKIISLFDNAWSIRLVTEWSPFRGVKEDKMTGDLQKVITCILTFTLSHDLVLRNYIRDYRVKYCKIKMLNFCQNMYAL